MLEPLYLNSDCCTSTQFAETEDMEVQLRINVSEAGKCLCCAEMKTISHVLTAQPHDKTEEKHNPNSHERLGRIDTPKSWSDLPLDLLNLVFKLLSFANFQRAKSVCSSWHSASRQCVPRSKHIHWLILFPEDNNDNNSNYSCMLFNPEEKDKLYRMQDLGLEFAKSYCIATYGILKKRCKVKGGALIKRRMRRNIMVPRLFRVTSHNGKVQRGFNIRCPVFWVDDKTKDYVVFWGLRDLCVVYSKKGDTSWNQIPETSDCRNMVYKDSMLYMISLFYGSVIIFDFSGEVPQKKFNRFLAFRAEKYGIFRTSLVVTVTGDVLTVEKIWRQRFSGRPIKWAQGSFRVVKVCSSGFEKKYEVIHSLGDESMLLDQGITVPADDNDGFIRNSIYSSASTSGENTEKILLSNIETGQTEPFSSLELRYCQICSVGLKTICHVLLFGSLDAQSQCPENGFSLNSLETALPQLNLLKQRTWKLRIHGTETKT
ncbi:unnamed protein product [Thlaspi arvense]|uniref:F-box domain-containing protein n=1 Tax=Thlaspi arvense TaxID=13288 RepID=A0AAU9T4Y2_THLAR|nr:unnamed protein product [Thlaspi arvense]